MTELLIPKQVDIEVTSHCNLRCKACPVLSGKAKAQHIDTGLYMSIVDRVNFPTTMIPWLNGEPLLHPEYYRMIKHTSDLGLRQYITTNATLWNTRLFELLTRGSSCYQLIFSLDGLPGSNSITAARPGSDPDLVVRHIKEFAALKVKNGNKLDMCVKICQRGQDYEEVEEYIYYWLNYPGVDFVCVGRILDAENTVSMRKYPCQYPDHNFMVVKSDGRLSYCAYNDDMTNDPANSPGMMDRTTPLLEIYNSENYRRFRLGNRSGNFHPVCKRCGFAYTGWGFQGLLYNRNPARNRRKLYYHQDYYNQFFSFKKNWKPIKYYNESWRG